MINQDWMSQTMALPLPIKPSEMEAWARLRGVKLRPWEVELIWSLDRCWLKAMRKGRGFRGWPAPPRRPTRACGAGGGS